MKSGDTLADDDTARPGAATIPAGGVRSPVVELQTVDPVVYQRLHEIARGGMGRITVAIDRRHGRSVAIKETLGDGDTTRFEREALVTARLQHPAIVPVYEAGRWPDGTPFYAMKMVAGRPLDKAIAEAATLEARLALLTHVLAACEALAYAHDQRIIHRDLKPSNVLVGSFGETVVIDWGLAKVLGTADAVGVSSSTPSGEMTVAGDVLGTPQYMPPEQASGQEVDERADVYALGAMLYHVLAGAPPYEAAPVHVMVASVIDGPPLPLERRAPEIPHDVLAIVAKAMSRTPEARYRDARDLVDDLRRFQTGQLVRAHTYTLRERITRFVRRNRAATAIAAAAAVALGIGTAIAVHQVVDEKNVAVTQAERADAEGGDADLLATQTLAEASTALDRLGHIDLLESMARRTVEHYERIERGGRLTDRRAVAYALALEALSRSEVKVGRVAQATKLLDHARHVLARETSGAPGLDAMRATASVALHQSALDRATGDTQAVIAHAGEARDWATRALAVDARDPLAAQTLAAALMTIANRDRAADDLANARSNYERAKTLLDAQGGDRDAAILGAQLDCELGYLEQGLGHLDLASARFEAAIDKTRAVLVAAATSPDLGALEWQVEADNGLAGLARLRGQLAEAARRSADAIDGSARLTAADPDNKVFASELALARTESAEIAIASHSPDSAAAELEQARAQAHRLTEDEPDNRLWWRDSRSHRARTRRPRRRASPTRGGARRIRREQRGRPARAPRRARSPRSASARLGARAPGRGARGAESARRCDRSLRRRAEDRDRARRDRA